MRCEVVAIGTELLLGQIVDTNSAWIGEQPRSRASIRTSRPTLGRRIHRQKPGPKTSPHHARRKRPEMSIVSA